MDSWLIYSCRNCSDCIGCTNLIGQTHCIFNKQYTKEEYKKKLKELNLSDRGNLEKIKKPTIIFFDDGFKDVLLNALPVLKKHKIKNCKITSKNALNMENNFNILRV